MANKFPASVSITAAVGPAGGTITNNFSNVQDMEFNFYENMLSITDGSNKYWFGFQSIATISCTILNGFPAWTISI